ncbi:MAG TPA: FAD/NAD(P)-binding protein [Pseudonocardiaceae bacterium]|nr:FAD/NAD(P)-binding protein [Pseudonocardiaceae bacterium]
MIVVVGAGPRGAGFLERLSANVNELLPDRRIDVHLVDPFPPGAGRVWRHEQSPLLRMNSMAEDVTMFTDDSVRCDGPIVPGPSLAEWGELARSTAADVDDELATLTGRTFATRRMASRYLSWFFDHVRETLPDTISVHVHTDTVTSVTGDADGPQQVWLAGTDEPLVADIVVFAIGHVDAETNGPARPLADFAARHGLYYLPPAYTADVDLTDIPAGEPVLVRGLGLAFIDLMALLTEGRGGTYRTNADGSLTYVPSGREPVLYVGSRRGVPYHAKIGYALPGAPPPLPRFFGADAVDELLATQPAVDFDKHVWPLLGKEVGWGYYHELAANHADRFAMPLADFAARYAELDWDSPAMFALVAEAVPDPADRWDMARLEYPLRGRKFDDSVQLQQHLRDYITADLARRNDQAHSADLGAFLALLYGYAQIPRIAASGQLDPSSRRDRIEDWWTGFFSFYASGPPGERLEQLLALSSAGLVRFLGADMWVAQDEQRGLFVAGSGSVDDTITARALVDARLPKATVAHTANGLLRFLREQRAGAEELLSDQRGTGLLRASEVDGRLIDPMGGAQRRRFALGPFTTVRTAAAFARPRTNAPAFRYNDAAARAVLRLLAEPVGCCYDAREEDGWQTNWCTTG